MMNICDFGGLGPSALLGPDSESDDTAVRTASLDCNMGKYFMHDDGDYVFQLHACMHA